MFQVRFHGRGGQGVVTAAELLAAAAFSEGRYAQAFPSFGSERMGAPVMSFCRIDDRPIRTREPVTEPDALVIQDPTLLHQADVFACASGYVLINATRGFRQPGLDDFAASHAAGGCSRPRLDLAMARLGRRSPAPRCSPRSPRWPAWSAWTRCSPPSANGSPARSRPGNTAAAVAAFDYVLAERRGTDRCLSRSRVHGAVAEAVALCRPQAICAYPITPQTHIVEALAALVKKGELNAASSTRVEIRRDVGRDRRIGGGAGATLALVHDCGQRR